MFFFVHHIAIGSIKVLVFLQRKGITCVEGYQPLGKLPFKWHFSEKLLVTIDMKFSTDHSF